MGGPGPMGPGPMMPGERTKMILSLVAPAFFLGGWGWGVKPSVIPIKLKPLIVSCDVSKRVETQTTQAVGSH